MMKNFMQYFLFAVVIIFGWMAFLPQENDAWKEKISPQLLAKAEMGEQIDFIALFEKQADVSAAKKLKTKTARSKFVFEKLQKRALEDQKRAIQLLQFKNVSYQNFYIVNAIQVKGDIQHLKLLAKLPEIRQINDNSPVKMEEPIDPKTSTQRGPTAIEWGIDMINADEVWALGYNGQGVVVGGQDTGYDWEHPALSATYRGNNGPTPDHNYNWHDAIHEINPLNPDSINPCGLDVLYPCDDHDHGTHTMGTMVGEDGDNQIGVAPGAGWIACRNMERAWGKPSTYIECFEWFMAPTNLQNENPDPLMSPHVIANSWSCPELEGCDSTNWSVMELVVDNLKASGVVVVVSAGNSGWDNSNNTYRCSSVSTPAAMFESSFSVGASAPNDTIANFSSRGNVTVNNSGILKPNVVAPGVSIRSCVRDSSYATWGGTSMAGPHVAGMVALMISANPDLAGQVEVIEDIIEATAVPKTTEEECGGIPGSEVPNNTYGYGRIDALAAVNAALAFVDTDENELEKTFVSVYPNPTDGLTSLEIKGLSGKVRLEVFDATGQLVQNFEWELTAHEIKTISLSALSVGIYFYKISNQRIELNGKIIKT